MHANQWVDGVEGEGFFPAVKDQICKQNLIHLTLARALNKGWLSCLNPVAETKGVDEFDLIENSYGLWNYLGWPTMMDDH